MIAWREILSQKKLVAIIILALVIGIVNTAVVTGLLRGFDKYINEDILEMMGYHVIISPSESNYINNSYTIMEKAEKLSDVYGVMRAIRYNVKIESLYGTVEFPDISALLFSTSMPRELMAVEADKFARYTVIPTKITKGQWLTGVDNELVIGETLASYLKVEAEDSVKVTFDDGTTNIFKVVGLIKVGSPAVDTNAAFVNIEDLEKIRNTHDLSTGIILKLFDKKMADNVKAELQGEGVQETIMTWDEMLGFVKDLLDMFDAILFIITSVSTVAASFGIAILMYINVIRKTKQIGTLKAIGASRGFIMTLFLLEAIIIAILGIIAGWIASFAVMAYLNASKILIGSYELQFVADYGILASSAIVTLVFAVIAALYPSYVASRLQVVEAMRHD